MKLPAHLLHDNVKMLVFAELMGQLCSCLTGLFTVKKGGITVLFTHTVKTRTLNYHMITCLEGHLKWDNFIWNIAVLVIVFFSFYIKQSALNLLI